MCSVPESDVICRVYQADYVAAKKYNHKRGLAPARRPRLPLTQKNKVAPCGGKTPPFKKQHIRVARLDARDPLADAHFPQGLFVAVEDDVPVQQLQKTIHRRKNLYLVFPTVHDHPVDGPVLLADHYTFCVDANDKKTPLHFHRTEYHPQKDTARAGFAKHTMNYLPAAFDLPLDASEFGERFLAKNGGALQAFAPAIAATMARPWLQPAPAASSSGGGKRRRRRGGRKVLDGTASEFEALWLRLPLHRMLVFGAPSPKGSGMLDVTVVVIDRLRHAPGVPMKGFFVRLSAADALHEARLQAAIARSLQGASWDFFADPPSDEDV